MFRLWRCLCQALHVTVHVCGIACERPLHVWGSACVWRCMYVALHVCGHCMYVALHVCASKKDAFGSFPV